MKLCCIALDIEFIEDKKILSDKYFFRQVEKHLSSILCTVHMDNVLLNIKPKQQPIVFSLKIFNLEV